MKKPILLLLFLMNAFFAAAQHDKSLDTLWVALSKAKTDTMRYRAARSLAHEYYLSTKRDSALLFGAQALTIAKKNKWARKEEGCMGLLANVYGDMGDYVKAMSYYFKAMKIAEESNDRFEVGNIDGNIGATYIQRGDYQRALRFLQAARKIISDFDSLHKSPDNMEYLVNTYLNIGDCYIYLNKLDSAEYAVKIAYDDCKKFKIEELGRAQRDLGEIAAEKGNEAGALRFFRQAFASDKALDDGVDMCTVCVKTANLYHQYKQQDSAEYYAQKALQLAAATNNEQTVLDAAKLLYTFYDEDHNVPQAYKYFKIATAAKDSIYSQDKIKQLLSIDFDEKERQQELQTAQKEAQTEAENRLRTYILSGGLGVLLLLALIFWRNSNQRKRANALLQSQNAEIEKQKKNVETTLGELKTTQAQLVQSAKMASLGELTAGIAHEIQNPLNFVNNFSDVNQEMLGELEDELNKGDIEEAKAIAADIRQNEIKINHHGKRADFIVKGMLEHSRTSTGEKTLTNINVLADEFLKLSHHGFSAKDKDFKVELVTHFDPLIPRMNIVQQDIGRVLVNLYNNAFYAVNEKAKTAGPGYHPEVTVTTGAVDGAVMIAVKDNGIGIPDSIKDKIMQPFFTTKPTGDGTGLGLSLSYDIVVKGHGGKINVQTKEGDFTEFTIIIPLA